MSDQQHIAGTSSFSDEPYQQSEAVPALPVSPGAVLAAERQARGWSVEYVASHLKLAIRQIHALEEDRYDALPGTVVTRGFIRIYAKMLGIDSTTLVGALPVDTILANASVRPSRTLSTPFSESSLPLRGRRELPVARMAWLGIGVLAIAGIFGAVKYGVWHDVGNSSLLQRLHMSGAAPAEIAVPVAESTEPGAEPVVVADSENSVPAEAMSTAQAMASVSEPAPAAAPAAPAPAPASASVSVQPVNAPAVVVAAAVPAAPVVPTAAATVATAGANPLQLTIRQDSWVEIRRADKTTLVSRVMKAGTTESFDIAGPVSMTIGNAAGVDATLRGQRLQLASSTGSNVARLSLK